MQHWNALRDTALATSNQCRRTVSRFTPLIYAAAREGCATQLPQRNTAPVTG
ncbi:hypothetical protein LBMAG49_18230 [Planctomycetota bacterium]|nr:hypothetical protein LBMAG49_18230 [Planctomycetota bacterium]